jgi:hypothetical protein
LNLSMYVILFPLFPLSIAPSAHDKPKATYE